MVGKEILNSVSIAHSLLPALRTADEDGADVDLQGYEAALCVVEVGAPVVTLSGSVYVQPTVIEADDDGSGSPSSYSAVAAGDLDGAFPKLDDNAKCNKAYAVAYMGSKRHIAIRWDVTGSQATGITASALVVRAQARSKPTTQGT